MVAIDVTAVKSLQPDRHPLTAFWAAILLVVAYDRLESCLS
jgi:hypothetical protein